MLSAPTCRASQARHTKLGTLRRLRGLPQAAVARHLRVSQPHIAQIEGQADMYLSTLRRYVEALGGELELIARFPDSRIEIELPQSTGTSPDQSISQQPSGGNHVTTRL